MLHGTGAYRGSEMTLDSACTAGSSTTLGGESRDVTLTFPATLSAAKAKALNTAISPAFEAWANTSRTDW